MTEPHHKSGKRASAKKVKCVCHERRLTVREGYHSYQLNIPFSERAPVPLIELKGNWLYQAGFTEQSHVKVRVMDQCLVVTVDK